MSADPKRKGRPPKKEDKRIFKIDVRFTEDEYKVITAMEKALGLNKTQLVRSRLLNNGAWVVMNAKHIIRQLNAIGAELGRSGNNLNQLAHYANILKLKNILSPVVAEKFNLLLEAHLKQRAELDTSLRRLIRALSDK